MTQPSQHPRVLVTGGGRGIGRAISLALATRGWHVLIGYAAGADAAAQTARHIAASGGIAEPLLCDVTDTPSLAALAAGIGPLAGLVHNAGILISKPLAATTPEDFDAMVAVNLKGPFFLTQALDQALTPGGRIVLIASSTAERAAPLFPAYAALKAGLVQLTSSLAANFGPRAITVNAIGPGLTLTDMTRGLADHPVVAAQVAQNAALGRMGTPDDVAGAVALLLSADASWITGQYIGVHGGNAL